MKPGVHILRHSFCSHLAMQGCPARAIRTKQYLYIRNYEPERWPAGDPDLYHSVGSYGDVDDSPTKDYILNNRSTLPVIPFFKVAFSKRPPEELYDLRRDPHQLNNVASDTKYRKVLENLRTEMNDWQIATQDPRSRDSHYVVFDQYPYFGPPVRDAPSSYKPGR